MHTESGDQWTMYTAWRSGGLCTQPRDRMGNAHTTWRTDELCIHKPEISWLHPRQEGADDTITVCLRGD